MFRVRTFFAALSEVLSAALEAVGVNPSIVTRRRDTYLYRETAGTVNSQEYGFDITAYHFGSMSEGTTTLGMNSDTDTLVTHNNFNIMYTLEDWKMGYCNYLMVRDKTTPAQHYMLQAFRLHLPLPVTHINVPFHVTDEHGRVFLGNRIVIDLHAKNTEIYILDEVLLTVVTKILILFMHGVATLFHLKSCHGFIDQGQLTGSHRM